MQHADFTVDFQCFGRTVLLRLGLMVGLFLFEPVAMAAPKPIYVVDVNRVVQESIVGKGAKADLEQSAKQVKAQIEKEQLAFKGMAEKVRKQAGLLSKEALQAKQEQLREKEKALSRMMSDKKEDLEQQSAKTIARIVKDVDLVIEELAKEEGYPVILERDRKLIVFVDKKYDLTDKVIAKLNKKRTAL